MPSMFVGGDEKVIRFYLQQLMLAQILPFMHAPICDLQDKDVLESELP